MERTTGTTQRFDPAAMLGTVSNDGHKELLGYAINNLNTALKNLRHPRVTGTSANEVVEMHRLSHSDLRSTRAALGQIKEFTKAFPEYKDALTEHLKPVEIFVKRLTNQNATPLKDEEFKALYLELIGAVPDNDQTRESTAAGLAQGAKKAGNPTEEAQPEGASKAQVTGAAPKTAIAPELQASVDNATKALIKRLPTDNAARIAFANLFSKPATIDQSALLPNDKLTLALNTFTEEIAKAKSLPDVKAAYEKLPAQAQHILSQNISEPFKAIFAKDKTGLCASLLKNKETWTVFLETVEKAKSSIVQRDPAIGVDVDTPQRQNLMLVLESMITARKRAMESASKAEPLAQQKMKSHADQQFKTQLATYIQEHPIHADDLQWIAAKVKAAPHIEDYANNLGAFMDKMKGLVSGKSLGLIAMFGLPILTSVLEHLPFGHSLASVCKWVMQLATMYSTATNLPGMFGGGSDKPAPPAANQEYAIAA